jgi:hypothetical protein
MINSFKDRILQPWNFEQIKAKPIFIEHERNFILFYTLSRLTVISLTDRA